MFYIHIIEINNFDIILLLSYLYHYYNEDNIRLILHIMLGDIKLINMITFTLEFVNKLFVVFTLNMYYNKIYESYNNIINIYIVVVYIGYTYKILLQNIFQIKIYWVY